MRVWRNLSAVLILLVAPFAQSDDATGKVLACMRANVPDTLRIQEVEMVATDRTGGTRTLKGRVFALREKGLVRAMIKISAPADLNGAAYLMRQADTERGDEIYFYLPAISRVRRISGPSADTSLLGTDFSYNDMKELQSSFAESGAKLEKPESIEQRPTYVLSLSPPAGSGSRYSTVRAWVDQKSCVALKIQFYEGQTLRKELTAPAASIQKSGNSWYTSEAQMRDLKEGTQTVLKIVGITEGADLPTRLFDPHSFYLGG